MTDPGHRVKCLKCRRWFYDKSPGTWTFGDVRAGQFPELCNDMCDPRHRSHTNCRGQGPYCPECATATEQELLAIREAYGR